MENAVVAVTDTDLEVLFRSDTRRRDYVSRSGKFEERSLETLSICVLGPLNRCKSGNELLFVFAISYRMAKRGGRGELQRMSTEIIDTGEDNIVNLICCPVCKDYIQPPSASCDQGHFMCAPCKRDTPTCPACGSSSFPNKVNSVFDRILREIYYPCINQENGCEQYLKYNEIKEHQKHCGYEKVPCSFKTDGCNTMCKLSDKEAHEAQCPFGVSCKVYLFGLEKTHEVCHWRGRKKDLFDHTKICHSKTWLPHKLDTNVTFPWMLPLRMEFQKTEFIRLEDVGEMFFLHVKCEFEGNQYITVQHVWDPADGSSYKYDVVFKNADKQVVFRDAVLPKNIDDVYSHESCCIFHYNFLKCHFKAERCCDCYIRIFRKGSEDRAGRKILQFLGHKIEQEENGSISIRNRESFREHIKYRLSIDVPPDYTEC